MPCLAPTDLSTCPDARPCEQEVVPASEKVWQFPPLARPGLVGSPLHLRHLLQDALPSMHQKQVSNISSTSFNPHFLSGSGKTRPWPGFPLQQGWPPWPPSGSSPSATRARPPSSQAPSWRSYQSKSQGWLSSARKPTRQKLCQLWKSDGKHDIFQQKKKPTMNYRTPFPEWKIT